MHTQVGIIGAGPAGLLLSHMLHQAGIESVVLERGNRDHVGTRLRAGGLEHGTVALLEAVGLGRRMREIGLIVKSTDFRFDGTGHRVDFMAVDSAYRGWHVNGVGLRVDRSQQNARVSPSV